MTRLKQNQKNRKNTSVAKSAATTKTEKSEPENRSRPEIPSVDQPSSKMELSEALFLMGEAPLYKERQGRIKMAIWAQEDKKGAVRFSLKLSRSYKTKAGFRDTSALDGRDIADAIALLTAAQELLPLPEVNTSAADADIAQPS